VQPPPPKKSGCWKWGAIGCGAALVLLVIGVAIIVLVVFGAIKSTDVYKEALSRAKNDPRVIQAIGSPVEAGFLVMGNVNVENRAGHADITFPIKGPRGKGTVHAVARREEGGWRYTELTAEVPNTPAINLLNSP
jgi:hypothetical protein